MIRTPRRVAFVLHGLDGGGAERVVLLIAGALAARGDDVHLYLAQRRGAYADAVPSGVAVHDLGAARVAAMTRPLVRELRRCRPDVVITALPEASVVGLVAARLASRRIRVIVTVHNHVTAEIDGTSWRKDRVSLRVASRAYRHADDVVCVSQGVAADLHRRWRGRRTPTVVHNPIVDPAATARRAAAVAPHPWLEDGRGPVLVVVGRLAPQKDVATSLDALALTRHDPPLRLLVLGDGPERAALESHALALGLADRVAFCGFLDDPLPAMARAAALVSSSRFEGFGNVLVEAMAVGTPVVATDCPSGPDEVLDGGRIGRLVPVGDAGAIARAIEATVRAPREPERLIAHAARWSIDAAVESYDALIGQRPILRVWMAGPATTTRGGMATVAAAILAAPPERVSIRHLGTWDESTGVHRLTLFVRKAGCLLAALATRRVDVVHLHVAEQGSVARKLVLTAMARVFRRPVVLHMHGARFAETFDASPRVLRRVVAAGVRLADTVVTLSPTEAAAYVARCRLDPARVVALPNPAPDPPRPGERARRRGTLGSAREGLRFLAVGRVGERKGSFELIEAFARICADAAPGAAPTLVLAGDGAVDDAQALAERLGVAHAVRCTGWLGPDDLARELAAADVFVLPSHQEALPMALLEASSWALPIITTAVGSIGDYFVHGDTCVLVTPGDVDGLASALASMHDPERRAALGAHAAALRETLGIEPYRRRLGQIYRQAAGG